MEIKHIKTEKLLEDENIKTIINMIIEYNEQVTDIPANVSRQLKLYGSNSISVPSQDFLLDYELSDKNYSGYEVSLFTITGIAVGQTWEFFYSSVNEDDTFADKVEDLQPLIKNILQLEIITELLDEISELDFSLHQHNKELPVEKGRPYKKNDNKSQAPLDPSKHYQRHYNRSIPNEGNLRPVASWKNNQNSKPRKHVVGFKSVNPYVGFRITTADGKIIGATAKPHKRSKAHSNRRRAKNLQMNMISKRTKR